MTLPNSHDDYRNPDYEDAENDDDEEGDDGDFDEYKTLVIEFFKSGRAEDRHWDELAAVLISAGCSYLNIMPQIDKAIGWSEED